MIRRCYVTELFRQVLDCTLMWTYELTELLVRQRRIGTLCVRTDSPNVYSQTILRCEIYYALDILGHRIS